MNYSEIFTRYGKSALAGSVMGLFGVSLCGAKTHYWCWGAEYQHSHDDKVLEKILDAIERGNGISEIIQHAVPDCFQQHADDLYSVSLQQQETKWTYTKSFIGNQVAFIATAIFGALFHDFIGKDLTVEINELFNTDISSYIVDACAIGTLSVPIFCSVVFYASAFDCKRFIKDINTPYFNNNVIIQAFILGVTAGLGAYCGDKVDEETSDEQADILDALESYNQINAITD